MAGATYTYSHNPATDAKDAVRSLIADTNYDTRGWLLSDQQILWAIAQEGSQRMAAALCCEMIAGSQSGSTRNIASRRIGDLAITYGGGISGGGQVDWLRLAIMLRARVAAAATISAGGIEGDEKPADDDDTSLTRPAFRRGQFDRPGMVQAGGAWSS